MGGDLFALVHVPGDEPTALDASGRAGSGADPGRLRDEGTGRDAVPSRRPDGDGPGLRRRLGRAPPALRAPPARRRAGAGDHAGGGRLPGLAAARRLARRCSTTTPDEHLAELVAQAVRPGALVRRPGVARTLRVIAEGGRAAFYGGVVRRGPARRWDRGTSPTRTWPAARPSGSSRWPSTSGAIASGPSLPPARATSRSPQRGSPRSCRCRRTPTTPGGPTCSIEAAIAAGHDRPEVLHERADGTALLASDRLLRRRESISVESTSNRRGARADLRRRHHLPVRGRRRPDGGVAHPVQRVRLRAAGWSSRARASTSTTGASASAWRRATRPSTGPAAARPTPSARFSSPASTARSRPRSGPWGATASPRSCCRS